MEAIEPRIELFTVYQHTSDFPRSVVVRRSLVQEHGETVDAYPCIVAPNLDDARAALLQLRPGLVCTARHPEDDPVIVEVWLMNEKPKFEPMTLRERELIPEHLQRGIINYIQRGIPTGDFLQAVFSNDLMDAFARADATSRRGLPDLCVWIFRHAPLPCYGSREAIAAWVKLGGLEGLIVAAERKGRSLIKGSDGKA